MRRQYYKRLSCEHATGYCDTCWTAALARGLSTEEWSALHQQAANQPLGTKVKGLPNLKPLAPAKVWNGNAIADISAAIEASIEDDVRPRCETFTGHSAHGFTIVKTDGHRALLTATPKAAKPAGKKQPLSGLADLAKASRYTWVSLPPAVDVAIRRVCLIHLDPTSRKQTPIVTLTTEGADLIVKAETPYGEYASERIALAADYPSLTVKLNATWLLEVVRGPLQLGLMPDKIMLRPASDDWRYVQMGYLS